MRRYILRRLGFSLITLMGITLLVFLIIHLIPGDPVEVITSTGLVTEEAKETMRQDLGLDQPLPVQYVRYMSGLLRGDLGRSIWTGKPVLTEVLHRAGATAELALFGLLLSVLIAIPAGIISATRAHTAVDYLSMAASFLGVSMPVFWIGILLMLGLCVAVPIFPALGRGAPFFPSLLQLFSGRVYPIVDSVRHLMLPAITLGFFNAAFVARMTRSSMLEVLNQDYIRTARSKGLPERVVVNKHAFRNALLPIVTVVGMQFGHMLGGAVLTETVFAWPGLGRFIVEGILARDYPAIQGALLVFGLAFLVVNLLTDLLYGVINPRIRLE